MRSLLEQVVCEIIPAELFVHRPPEDVLRVARQGVEESALAVHRYVRIYDLREPAVISVIHHSAFIIQCVLKALSVLVGLASHRIEMSCAVVYNGFEILVFLFGIFYEAGKQADPRFNPIDLPAYFHKFILAESVLREKRLK